MEWKKHQFSSSAQEVSMEEIDMATQFIEKTLLKDIKSVNQESSLISVLLLDQSLALIKTG